MINQYNDFLGFSELSLAALSNDDMLAFFRENRFIFKNQKGKREEESLYTIEEYVVIREGFLKWVKDKNE
jgi:hypothetical protein